MLPNELLTDLLLTNKSLDDRYALDSATKISPLYAIQITVYMKTLQDEEQAQSSALFFSSEISKAQARKDSTCPSIHHLTRQNSPRHNFRPRDMMALKGMMEFSSSSIVPHIFIYQHLLMTTQINP